MSFKGLKELALAANLIYSGLRSNRSPFVLGLMVAAHRMAPPEDLGLMWGQHVAQISGAQSQSSPQREEAFSDGPQGRRDDGFSL